MKRRLIETTILISSVLKWSFLSFVVGSITGFAVTLFVKCLEFSTERVNQFKYYYFLLPLALFITRWLSETFFAVHGVVGTDKVIEAIHKRSGKLSLKSIPANFLLPILTISCGGSAGKEAPSCDLGASVSSLIAKIFKFKDTDRKKLVICGISAGFASVFGTPIAGAIFGLEVLYVGGMFYEALLPSLISGFASYLVSSSFGIYYFRKPIEFTPVLSSFFIFKMVFVGILFGMLAFIFVEVMHLMNKLSSRLKIWSPLKGFLAGLILVLLTQFFGDRYLGMGLDHTMGFLGGESAFWFDSLLKIVYTAITLSFGGVGGLVAPIFFVGSSAGSVIAPLFGIDRATLAAVGIVAVLAGAKNTPFASILFAIELFGSKLAPYATLACVVSFLVSGIRGIYPSQLIAMRKSASIDVEIGKEIRETKISYSLRKPRKKDDK